MHVQYFDNNDVACFNGYSFRRDKKTGYYLSSKKIGDKRKRLHVYVWETSNGTVPDGYAVHHIDENKNNNEIENLTILSKSEHSRLHMQDEDRKQRARVNMIENVMPRAKEWHSTPEGLAWHSQHAKEVFNNVPYKDYVCDYCGKPFKSKKTYQDNQHTFCCNNCKSAFRRKSGVDDIEKICSKCGKTFMGNKYSKTQTCPDCRRKVNRKDR